MHLKISAPGGVLFDGSISKITLPTTSGEISVLPGHQPLTSVVKSGVVSFVTSETLDDQEYTMHNGAVQVAVSSGLVLIDGETVIITTSAATSSPSESEEVLTKMKADMEKQLATIRDDGNAEDLERALENMEKIQAELKLAKIGNL